MLTEVFHLRSFFFSRILPFRVTISVDEHCTYAKFTYKNDSLLETLMKHQPRRVYKLGRLVFSCFFLFPSLCYSFLLLYTVFQYSVYIYTHLFPWSEACKMKASVLTLPGAPCPQRDVSQNLYQRQDSIHLP